ncbi:MAG TPA: FkbM family methyltransferase [Candidatus Krumholzibacteria bacterium]
MAIFHGTNNLSYVVSTELAVLFAEKNKALEWNLIEWAEQFLDPQKTFVDVGAHVGTWTISYARKVPRVIAIEAERKNYYRLVAGVALNELWNVECHHAAAGARHRGEVTLNVGVNDWSGFGGSVENFPINGETRPEKVTAISIDGLKLSDVGLVKIDVEGHERHVLTGMRRTLERCGNPPIVLECWSDEVFPWYAEERKLTLAALESMGYNAVPIAHWPHMLLCAHP